MLAHRRVHHPPPPITHSSLPIVSLPPDVSSEPAERRFCTAGPFNNEGRKASAKEGMSMRNWANGAEDNPLRGPTDPSQWDSCSPNQCLCSNCSAGSSCRSIAFITILLQISPPWIPLLFRVQRQIFLSQFLSQIDPQLRAHIEALINQWQNCLKTLASFFSPFANVYNSWETIKAPKAEKERKKATLRAKPAL